MVFTSSGCRKLQMRFTKVKWSFTCLFLYHVKEVGDFFFIFEIFIMLCLNMGCTLQSPKGLLDTKGALPSGQLQLQPSQACEVSQRERSSTGTSSPDRKHGFNQSCKPAVGFQVQGECFEILCKGLFPAGGVSILRFSFHWCSALPGPWWAGQNPRENKEGISIFTKNECRCILKT